LENDRGYRNGAGHFCSDLGICGADAGCYTDILPDLCQSSIGSWNLVAAGEKNAGGTPALPGFFRVAVTLARSWGVSGGVAGLAGCGVVGTLWANERGKDNAGTQRTLSSAETKWISGFRHRMRR
jgi:hypothetical protein